MTDEDPTPTGGRPLHVGPINRPQIPGALRAPAGATPSAKTGVRSLQRDLSNSAKALQRVSWVLLALPFGALSLNWPIPGLALTLGAVLLIAGTDRKGAKGNRGAADLLVAPIKFVQLALRPFFHSISRPTRLIRAVILIVLAVVAAGALAAGLGWLNAPNVDDNQSWATTASVRMRVWSDGPRFLAALVAVLLILSVSKEAALRRRFDTAIKRLSENQLTATAVVTTLVAAGIALALNPSPWAPFGSSSDFVRNVPIPGMRDAALAVADNEAEEVLHCFANYLYDDLGGLYDAAIEATDRGDQLEVAFGVPEDVRLTLEQRTAIIISLHNQLPTWIDQVQVASGREVVLTRASLDHSRPIFDPTALKGHIAPAPDVDPFDADLRHAVAECSVVAP